MTVLALRAIWVNLADTGDGVSAPSIGRSFSSTVGGETRNYAGGRIRFVNQEGITGSLDVTLRLLTLDQVETLELWRGRDVLIRDHRGQHWWGVYSAVARIEHKGILRYDAALTLQLITHDEGV